ncbi:MAG: hypothetical protein NTW50_00715 [Candidatus Berkelbacteria bacterium]|nr:hypothetical protein [Candidatus Berkelbacteria bacterium]
MMFKESNDNFQEDITQNDRLRNVRQLFIDFSDLPDDRKSETVRLSNEILRVDSTVQKFQLIYQKENELVYTDDNGEVTYLTLEPDKIRQILSAMNQGQLSDESQDNYLLRQELFNDSRGQIQSFEAFSSTSPSDPNLSRQLDDETSWYRQRRGLHSKIIDSELKSCNEIGEKLEKNMIYAVRGNSASGKSTWLKNGPVFSSIFQGKADPNSGVIDPDIYRNFLLKHDNKDGRNQVKGYQEQKETAMITRRILRTALNQDLSVILDMRFNETKDIDWLVQLAESYQKELKVVPFV